MGNYVSTNIIYGVPIPQDIMNKLDEDNPNWFDDYCKAPENSGLDIYYCGDTYKEFNTKVVYICDSELGECCEDYFNFAPAKLIVIPSWNDLLKKFCDDHKIPFEPSWYCCGRYG